MPIITHTMCTLGLLHKVTIRMPQQLEVTVDAYNLRTTFTVVYIIQSCIHFTNHGPSLPEIQPTTHAYGCTYIRTYVHWLTISYTYQDHHNLGKVVQGLLSNCTKPLHSVESFTIRLKCTNTQHRIMMNPSHHHIQYISSSNAYVHFSSFGDQILDHFCLSVVSCPVQGQTAVHQLCVHIYMLRTDR